MPLLGTTSREARRAALLLVLRDPATPGDARRRAAGDLVADGFAGTAADVEPALTEIAADRGFPDADRVWAATELVEPTYPGSRDTALAALRELATCAPPPIALDACEALAEWGDEDHRAWACAVLGDLVRDPTTPEPDRDRAREWIDFLTRPAG